MTARPPTGTSGRGPGPARRPEKRTRPGSLPTAKSLLVGRLQHRRQDSRTWFITTAVHRAMVASSAALLRWRSGWARSALSMRPDARRDAVGATLRPREPSEPHQVNGAMAPTPPSAACGIDAAIPARVSGRIDWRGRGPAAPMCCEVGSDRRDPPGDSRSSNLASRSSRRERGRPSMGAASSRARAAAEAQARRDRLPAARARIEARLAPL